MARDIRTMLGHLRMNFDNVKKEELQFRFNDFHRQIRVLDDLMSYTMKDLSEEYGQLSEISDLVFEEVKTLDPNELNLTKAERKPSTHCNEFEGIR